MTLNVCPTCIAGDDVFVFGSEEMNVSVREIWQASSVVQVKVRYDNVPDILGMESKLCELVDRRFRNVSGTAQRSEKQSHRTSRLKIVAKAESCIHKHRAFVGIN